MDDEMAKKLSSLISNFKSNQNFNAETKLSLEEGNNFNHKNEESNKSFDFENIDFETLLKLKTIFEKVNDSSDPRANLLTALKPYLKNEKRNKIEQYIKLLNMTKVFEAFKNYSNGENK